MIRPGREAPWRLWAPLALAAVIAVVGLTWGIARLPVAPNVSTNYSTPDTAAGSLALQIESMTFASAQVAWAVVPLRPNWSLDRSTDAGHRWVDVTPLGAPTSGGLEVTVLSPTSALLAYRPYEYERISAFAVTVDGGSDWTTGILPNAVANGPDPMALVTTHSYWAVLGSGLVATSSNSGASWSSISLPAPPIGSCQATSIRFISAEVGWVTGSCQGTADLWQTVNGGVSWQVRGLGDAVPATERVLVSLPEEGASGGIFTTVTTLGANSDQLRVFSDNGGIWTAVPSESLPAGRLVISFAGSSDGWVLDATSGKGALALVYQTSDGGRDWALRATPIAAAEVTSLSVRGSQIGYALAQQGTHTRIWSTTNGGQTWSGSPLQSVAGPPPRTNGITP